MNVLQNDVGKIFEWLLCCFGFQLIVVGVLDKLDYLDFEEEIGILFKDDDLGKCFF